MWKLRYLKVNKFRAQTPKRVVKEYITFKLVERKQRGVIK